MPSTKRSVEAMENSKEDKVSPTKQRTPLQLPKEKKVGIYFAQTKRAMDAASNLSDSSDSGEDEEDAFDNHEIAEDGTLKKRKRTNDPEARKLAKIRKTFNSNVTVVEYENDEFLPPPPPATESTEKASPKKVLKDSSLNNVDVSADGKGKAADVSNVKEDKENVDSQLPESLEGLDDFFEDEWSINKSEKNKTDNGLDDLFEDEWSYDAANIDLSKPKRCIITDVIWETTEIIVTLKDPSNAAAAVAKCSGSWRYTQIAPGEYVVVKAKKQSAGDKYWIVDNDFGWIINQPDTLISGTSVVSALWCNRRSIFQEKFRNIGSLPYYEGPGHFMLTGSLTHELLQTVLEKEIFEVKKINEVLDELLKSKHAIQMMYEAKVSMAECKNIMKLSVGQIYKFIQRYVKGVEPDAPDNNFDGKIEKICDIEENVWLPSLGIKGKIDLTVEVSTKSKNQLFPSSERKVIPLEIKTGRASFSSEHQGQLILYTMMMNMTNRKTDSGLLLYLRENTMREIIGNHHVQRDIIVLRNTVAYYTTRVPVIVKTKSEEKVLPMELPKPINHRSCDKCTFKTLCCTYLSSEDKNELQDGHHLKSLHETATSHLSPEHIEYVMKWVTLMQIEESAENQDVTSWSDIWTMTPLEREKRGTCLSSSKIVDVTMKYGRYLHEFQRLTIHKKSKDIDLLDFTLEEYVIISTKDRVNICSGYIDNITSTSMFVRCIKDITKIYKSEEYHVDKNTFTSFLSHNLSQLGGLLDDHEICSKLRKIVIERQPATFDSDLPESLKKVGKDILDRLNENQRKAILKALTTDNYLLIKGFPGTGKTQTVVAMIELLVKLDMSVLVTAHTNTALDNILLKLIDRKVDFIRLGSDSRAHPALVDKLDNVLASKCDSPEALHTMYCSKKVVGVTCYGSTHAHLSQRKFDFCIVDESTQVLQPTILRPLYCASKFILIGDPEQLPPIAKSNVARKMGINESLFARLDTENNTVSLTQQYRMNNCIMNVANKLTYNNQLQVGSERVAISTMPLTNCADLESCERWIRKALSLRLRNSVIMLNTSATYHLTLDPSIEQKKGKNFNYWETAIILRLTEVLKNLGIDTQEVGIIAPYRSQVQLLRSVVSSDIEVNTVDQYQGRDKSVIIYSCSKSIPKDTNIVEFDILEDKQRLTVAVTRAKHKLIIVGDLNTLQRYTPFKKLTNALKSCDQIYDLRDNEDDFSFEDLIRILV